MSISERPAVQRVQPPKAPLRVANRVLGWVLSSPRRVSRVGEDLLLLHLSGRKTGRRINVDRVPTHEELVDAARRDGLSLSYLQVSETER